MQLLLYAQTLKQHLQNLFIDDMSYDNYGKWEIDHINPLDFYFNDINNSRKYLINPLDLCNFNDINDIRKYLNYY